MDRSPLTLTPVHWVSLALQSSVIGRHSMSQRIENTVSHFWFRTKISPPSLQALGRPSVFPFFNSPQNLIKFYFFNFYFFFSWRIIALQCCVGFCLQQGGSVIIICIYLHPSRSSRSSRLSSPCYRVAFHKLYVSHIIVYKCQCYFLSSSHPFLPQLCPQSVLYICISNPSLQIGSSVLFF